MRIRDTLMVHDTPDWLYRFVGAFGVKEVLVEGGHQWREFAFGGTKFVFFRRSPVPSSDPPGDAAESDLRLLDEL